MAKGTEYNHFYPLEMDEFSRFTNFTKDEQITMMTLWCIFRSPLMIGGELRDNDSWTLSLLTNRNVLRLLSCSYGARQVMRTEDAVIWSSLDVDGSIYVALVRLGMRWI